ncbi:hypothetical protein [Paraburkholderia humisilvae]|uniref:Uncharacterized protein n=1 Tax=Paraburkholderia humisilvae TaxID=627669 RepID=A0A6J5DRE0_9BURK|nr:hypothetical protein [Paraburkholderia humisilvae]CAB3755495.1 hypothetical protein LMG29542_02608 [Paraburkholderia humisilvae]
MVLVFFCVSGVLDGLGRHPSITTREDEPEATRSLELDTHLFAQTIEPFPGVLVVVANDWPFFYDLDVLRQECAPFGRRIVNAARLLGDTKEEAVHAFMATRPDPCIVVSSTDFEFSKMTEARRVDVSPRNGFDKQAAARLLSLLNSLGDDAKRPVSRDELLRASVGPQLLRRVEQYAGTLRAASDSKFQHRLAEMLSRTRIE